MIAKRSRHEAALPQRSTASNAWAKAGVCQTIERSGFRHAESGNAMCSRCDKSLVYRRTYCEENIQQLGQRCKARSNLTWYESLLIARGHPMMSEITLTSTGLLCYAGHVCNYYVKVLEWFRELPAVLRDKKWFLIKRRRSIRSGAGELRQKKPTTANRRRLEAAIAQAMVRMPNVYAGSERREDLLAEFPDDGEREMLEQEEHIDLKGSVAIPEETFVQWMKSSESRAAMYPCAAAIMRYTTDQQGVDLRGGVSGESAWELCGRLMTESRRPST